MPFSSAFRRALVPVLVCLLGLVACTGRGCGRSRPVRLVLAPAGNWEGLSENERRGVVFLLKDLLEVGGDLPVVDAQELRGAPADDGTRVDLTVRKTPRGLDWRFHRNGDAPGAVTQLEGSDPSTALLRLGTALGMRPEGVGPLLPKPELFWELVELYGWVTDEGLAPAQLRAEVITAGNPDCVTAWLVLARLDHRRLVLASDADPRTQGRCHDHFEKVMELMPHHPQGAHHLGIFLTDTGDQRGALEVLFRSVEQHPKVAHLRSAMAYAARTAGLLEGAQTSIRIRDELQGPSRAGRNLAENVLLYRGDWKAFEANLGEGPDPFPDPVPDFYRGYIRLIQGDREGALRWFKIAQEHPNTKLVFEQLAHIYQLALEDRRTEALAALDTLQDQRLRLRVPDGEFTFKVAEAYGLLGREEEAMLIAERAFSQGFGCARWIEDSPLLRGVHGHPRWRALVQHALDRQSLLEGRFPPQRFAKR